MKRRGTPEADLQRAVVTALRFTLPKGAIIHHSANEVTEAGPRGAKRQAILVGMGVHAGFADLIVLCEGRVLFIELKSLKGRLNPAQEAFRDAVLAQGFGWASFARLMTRWGPWRIMDLRRASPVHLGGSRHEPCCYQLGDPATRAKANNQDRTLASV